MRISIHTRGFVVTEALKLYILQRMRFALGWARIGTRTLAVSLSDINGPRGGNDKRCKIQMQLVGGKAVVIEDTEPDMYLAIDRAAERAARALTRQLARTRAFPREAAPHKRAAGAAGALAELHGELQAEAQAEAPRQLIDGETEKNR